MANMVKTMTKLTISGFVQTEEKENEARELLEKLRWANGVYCPRCDSMEIVKVEAKGKIRKGLYRCKNCRRKKLSNQFTVTVGTIFEDSHIKLQVWIQAIILMCSSKKGISAHQLHRQLGITYKSAWFMAHRIRHGLQIAPKRKMNGIVEADETYVGGKNKGFGKSAALDNKTPVVALVSRDGEVRSFPVQTVSAKTLKTILLEHVSTDAELMTDELPAYEKVGKQFYSHDTVNHSRKEYARGHVNTNTVEGFFSILKRGINGVYHHVSREHLNKYLIEFNFRYNHRKVDDETRVISAIKSFEGKRLTYN
jgi:transposase-like protein